MIELNSLQNFAFHLGTIISSLKDNEVKDYLKKHNITEDELIQLKTVLYKIGETFYIKG